MEGVEIIVSVEEFDIVLEGLYARQFVGEVHSWEFRGSVGVEFRF